VRPWWEDFGADAVERDERRLAELGRRTIEMYVLSHLFVNRVEVAFMVRFNPQP
jgi:hypothetical protein